jgi:hypothetical protein
MPLTASAPIEINWLATTRHYSLNSPNQVERADVVVGRRRYELIAFDLQCSDIAIGWEIRAGRNFGTSVINGSSPDFAAAKAAAEAALRAIQDIPAETLRKPVTAQRSAP